MFELIPSEWMRNYLKDKREFNDWEKAALIWNSPVHIWRERLDSLKELSAITDDEKLKCQIDERISYEERAYQLFINNRGNNFVYVVFDDDRNPCGYFSDYEMARLYGIKYCEEYECSQYSIEKQLLYGETTKNELIKPWISKNCILKADIPDEDGYSGTENGSFYFNSAGDVLSFYSLEMSAEDQDKVDELSRQRFEYRFIKIPFGMEEGTIVKLLNNGSYAVLAQGEDSWNEYMTKTDENPFGFDYSDIQTIVFVLKDDGHWSHVHVNPMYLEPGLLEVKDGDKKAEAYRDALTALSSYFRNKTGENNEKAIMASRAYADECAGALNWARMVYEADDIEKILW